MKNKSHTKQKNFKRASIRRLIVVGVLAAVFVVLYLLTLNTKVCEWFATTVSRVWIKVFGTLLGWIPFSLYELFLIVAILGIIAFVVIEIVLLCKHKWQKSVTAVLIVAITLFAFLDVYTTSASFAYNRDPLPTSVYEEYSGEDLSVDEAVQIAEYIIAESSSLYDQTKHDSDGNIVYPYDFAQLSQRLAEEYKRLDSGYFSSYTPRGKRILNKTIMSELGISGVFFAPFGEANVNGIETGLTLPFTLGHELAHGKGVMREYEADLVAAYVLMTSDDPYLRYGITVQFVYRAIDMVSLYPDTQDTVTRLNGMIDNRAISELSRDNSKWAKYDTLDKIGEFFNDLYLKLQKQEGGTNSYYKPGDIVDTGDKDSDDRPIKQIIRFGDMQNLLIKLYKQGYIANSVNG